MPENMRQGSTNFSEIDVESDWFPALSRYTGNIEVDMELDVEVVVARISTRKPTTICTEYIDAAITGTTEKGEKSSAHPGVDFCHQRRLRGNVSVGNGVGVDDFADAFALFKCCRRACVAF